MKILKLFMLFLGSLLLCSCDINHQNLDNAHIYTTVYPLTYIANYLYGNNSTIESIYPDGVDLSTYSLTEKQIDTYAKGDLFIHLGYANEKDIARTLIKKNKDILIIDGTYEDNYSLEVVNDFRELWLAPNNYINMLKNVKNAFKEYLDNAVKEEAIDNLYNELFIKLSWMDADLRSIAEESKALENNTLVVSSKALKFLENYGFNVICLQELEESGSTSAIDDLKNKFKTKYNAILKLTSDKETDLIKELVNNNKAKIITINDMITNSDQTNDYISIQNENIAAIRDLLVS